MSTSKQKFKVVTRDLREEAKHWQNRADHAYVAIRAVQSMTLRPSAFAVADFSLLGVVNADLEARFYEEFRQFMEKTLTGAYTEFHQVDKALRDIADEYDRTEDTNRLDIGKFYKA
ncbi:hypothetical protein ACIA8G_11820 [Lentzea sp. NPDC051213]|uniref:hypothetical protein n=1 Tax=Lentzea sp. NPDC051213 TaxID=3364126 RepID=UPI0037B5A5F0